MNIGIVAIAALTLAASLQGCASRADVASLDGGARVHVDLPAIATVGNVLIHGTMCREGADPVSPRLDIVISKLHSDAEPARVTLSALRERSGQCRFFTARPGWAFSPGDSLRLCVTDKSRDGTPPRCEVVHAG